MYSNKHIVKDKATHTGISYWNDSIGAPIEFSKLDKNIETDVVIVGGGIAGLSIAYCIARTGKRVCIVDDASLGSGETGHTTAHLVNALDDRYYELEQMYGKETAKLIADSHTTAINFIEETISRENIECDFKRVDGYLFLHPSDKKENLEKEFAAAKRAGLRVEIKNSIPGMKNAGACLCFKDQAQFHPMKYLAGLSKAIEVKGGQIFTNTHAKEISSEGIVTDEGYRISAQYVVVATNSPVNDKYAMHLKQFPYRTYVIGATVPKGSLPQALWWDTGDFEANPNFPPYHYIRLQDFDNEHDLLICGGEDHPTGLADADVIPEENRFLLLESWARERFPMIETVVYAWSGQVLEPHDSLAYIGKNPWDKKNVFIATGDSGNGMTHGTIAGLLINDLIHGVKNEWAAIYDPSRFHLFASGKTLLGENINGIIAYIRNNPDGDAPLDLQPGKEGQIINREGKKYGAYIDHENHFHLVSATCTHLGCTIKWNNAEKSWDCPCHGSRFSYEGKILNGPANKNLEHHTAAYNG
jgi:glycine/D-amino acid oxidase-like deaminating enzyme/nitrite reductase/ring-hydroxylating ferredoxin subunit